MGEIDIFKYGGSKTGMTFFTKSVNFGAHR